jgi:hypothetical protein
VAFREYGLIKSNKIPSATKAVMNHVILLWRLVEVGQLSQVSLILLKINDFLPKQSNWRSDGRTFSARKPELVPSLP